MLISSRLLSRTYLIGGFVPPHLHDVKVFTATMLACNKHKKVLLGGGVGGGGSCIYIIVLGGNASLPPSILNPAIIIMQ